MKFEKTPMILLLALSLSLAACSENRAARQEGGGAPVVDVGPEDDGNKPVVITNVVDPEDKSSLASLQERGGFVIEVADPVKFKSALSDGVYLVDGVLVKAEESKKSELRCRLLDKTGKLEVSGPISIRMVSIKSYIFDSKLLAAAALHATGQFVAGQAVANSDSAKHIRARIVESESASQNFKLNCARKNGEAEITLEEARKAVGTYAEIKSFKRIDRENGKVPVTSDSGVAPKSEDDGVKLDVKLDSQIEVPNPADRIHFDTKLNAPSGQQ